ncbi:fibronectin type III domain-containing protein [Paenibacillus polysaccharolyticus]|uniref:RCC1 domain-containing protein n=1 Tax=Paenibacillus polysaccharolyticus TaxID=582692 RepID=UPI00203B0B34|nr:fibronectin type III domain-containing protein [Paenibacillus polysaccharolyticus]
MTMTANLAEMQGMAAVFSGSTSNSSFIITSDGIVKAWGGNSNGQLGIGNTTQQSNPVFVSSLADVKQIVAGGSYTLALMNDGTVKAWGNNYYGQLGIGSATQQLSPVPVPDLSGVSQLVAGGSHMLALMNDGTVKAWGNNNAGQLGIGNTTRQPSPVPVQDLSGVRQLVAGSNHTLALMNDGTVKAWGNNVYGQLGIGNTTQQPSPVSVQGLSGVKQLVAGSNHTLVLMNDGTVKAWGNNDYGQLGNGNTTQQPSPVSVQGLSGVKQLVAGSNHTLALMNDGTVKAWGSNNYGQLGNGNTTQQPSPVPVPDLRGVNQLVAGSSHTLSLMNDGTVKAWGNNVDGQLGIGSAKQQPSPVPIPDLRGVSQLVAGGSHMLALMNDGTVKAWGSNNYGQLGNGNTTQQPSPVPVQGLSGVKQLIAGSYHMLALMNDGTVKAWGSNNYGQLGNGNTTQQSSPVPVQGLSGVKQIVAGSNHTLALMNDGTVKAWGYNYYGQLGIGNTTQQSSPVPVQGLSGVSQLVADSNHTFAIMNDGTVKAWGNNYYGQLGIGHTAQQPSPLPVQGLRGVSQLVAGGSYMLALMSDGTVKAWGNNVYGQLGIGSTTQQQSPLPVSDLRRVSQLVVGSNHTLALMNDGTVKAWGSNNAGQLGIGYTTQQASPVSVQGLRGVKQLVAGGFYTLALMNDGTVKAWGSNNAGQLGIGNMTSEQNPILVQGLNGVMQLAEKGDSVLALMDDETVKAWGSNTNSQLGSESISMSSKPIFVTNSEYMTPKVHLSGSSGTPVLVEYAIDSETTARERKSVVLSSGDNLISFETAKLAGLSNGAHTLTFTANNSTQTVKTTVSFQVFNQESRTNIQADSTNTTITMNGTTSNTADTLRFTLGNFITAWLPSPASYTYRNLQPNRKYTVFADFKDSTNSGLPSAQPIDVYTKASTPSLGATTSTSTTAVLVVTDDNPSETQYQVLSGGKTLGTDGRLTAQSIWMTLPSLKKIRVSGLTSGKGYVFQIKARNTEGVETELSNRASIGPVQKSLSVPTGLRLSAAPNSVTLTWDAVNGAIGYEVEADGITGATESVNGLIHQQNGLLPNSVHIYRVRAAGENGIFSSWSEPMTIRTLLPVPAVPKGITSEATARTVTLQWEDVAEAVGYELEWDGQIVSLGKQTQYKAVDLQPGSQHTYRLRAINGGGNSGWSVRATVMTSTNVPGIPAGLTGDSTNNSVTLSWQPMDDATGFEVEADGVISNAGDTTTAGISGLAPQTTHTYRVRAVNEMGTGPWSEPMTQTTYLLPSPGNVQYRLQDTAMTLTWEAVAGAVNYEVMVDGQSSTVTELSFTKSGLTAESAHTLQVRANGGGGNSNWSKVITVTTLPVKPAVPDGIQAIAGKDAVTLSWNTASSSASLDYEVEMAGGGIVSTFGVNGYADLLLDPYSNHTYRVRAKTDAVEGDWSELITIRTLPDISKAPADIAVRSNGSLVTLTWSKEPSAWNYEVEVDGQVQTPVTDASFVHRRAAKGMEHRYRIRTINAAGNGDWSPLIVNNTMTARMTKGKPFDLSLTASDVTDFTRYSMTVAYDPNVMEVKDLSRLTGKAELGPGRIEGTDITVVSFKPGSITFTSDKAVNKAESWTGVLNSIRFSAKAGGGSSITYSVFDKQ